MSIAAPIVGLLAAPLIPGVINRIKALFAGRSGPPLLQAYFDMAKLLRKGAVFSRTTTWIFWMGPLVSLAALTAAALLVPCGPLPSPLSFSGDCLLFAYLMGLSRFFTMLSAMDTGSAFEGMGASREAFFSALTETVFFLCFILLAMLADDWSFAQMLDPGIYQGRPLAWATFLFLAAGLFTVILAENSRVPFDDPNTHLELTMIHEVMVLDHSGPDLAIIEYGAALKLWLLMLLLVQMMVPHHSAAGAAGVAGGILALAILIGITESVTARLQLSRVPQLISGAFALAGLGVVFLLR